MAKSWTVDAPKALELHAAGKSTAEIAVALGRTNDSVRSWFGGRRRDGKQAPNIPPPAVEDVRAFQESAHEQRIRQLEQQLHDMATKPATDRVAVECDAEPSQDPRDMWLRIEEDSARRIEHAKQRGRFRVKLDDEVVGVSFVSDQHIAPGTPVDHKRMREDAELIAATDGLVACLAGDGVDNHIKHRAAVLAARSQPGDQWQLFEWYLSIFAHKIVAMCSGNHCAWTNQFAGIDMVAKIAKDQRLCYTPDEARIDLVMGEQTYKIAFRHQYRMNSSFNQCHAIKQWFRLGEELFDVGAIGHHHESSIEAFEGHGLTRWACRPGAYQITSAYSRQFGFNDAVPTCPTFLFWKDKRHIIGFRDVRDAVLMLKSLRGAT